MKLVNALPAPLVDILVRRRARLHETPIDRFCVRIAHDIPDYEDAFTLLHVAYVFQGIENVRGKTMRITPQHVLPESTVFVAYEDDVMVGTMTVTLDSPAGLPLDKDYPEQVKRMRDAGQRLVEYGSLAVVRRCWSSGVTNLLNAAAHWWSRHALGASHCIIGVNPKAVPWYRAVYRFRVMGEPRHHAELAAPVQGMAQDLEEVEDFLERRFREPLANSVPVGLAYKTLELPCVDLPRDTVGKDLTRWKLPRAVFRDLFVKKSDIIDSLDPAVRTYLEMWRSPRTLQGGDSLSGSRD